MIEFLITNEYAVKPPKFEFPANAGIDGYIPTNTEKFREKLKEKNANLVFVKDDEEQMTNYFREVTSWMNITTGEINIAPHSDLLIPSGLYVKMPEDSALIDFNKSGIATKKKLVAGACVIDYSYQGIVHYHVINTSDVYQTVKCDEKILQMVEVKIGSGAKVIEGITPDEFFVEKSSRGEGGFGSTTLL